MLLPTEHTAVRRSLSNWFDSKRIHPVVNGEFDDSALLFQFGQSGAGIFPAPTIVEAQVRRTFNVRLVGRTRDVRERFYAITVGGTTEASRGRRRLRHVAGRRHPRALADGHFIANCARPRVSGLHRGHAAPFKEPVI